MLEAAGFDFRSRHPQQLLIKFLKHYGHAKDSRVSKLAFKISLDLYRTFAPLKQCSAGMAMACLELATRLDEEMRRLESSNDDTEEDNGSGQDHDRIAQLTSSRRHQQQKNIERDYPRYGLTRAHVTETLLDLLDLYIHHRQSTAAADIPLDAFLQVRIPLNEEMDAKKLPRYTEYIDVHPPTAASLGTRFEGGRGGGDVRNGRGVNGSSSGRSSKNVSPKDGWGQGQGQGLGAGKELTSPSTGSSGAPGSGSTNATSGLGEGRGNAGVAGPREGGQPGIRQRIGERGRDGTVRFMLNPERERKERGVVSEYGREDMGG